MHVSVGEPDSKSRPSQTGPLSIVMHYRHGCKLLRLELGPKLFWSILVVVSPGKVALVDTGL